MNARRYQATKNFLWILVIFALPLLSRSMNAQEKTTAATSSEKTAYRPLFDGKSLNGWEGNLEFFRVEKAAIVAGNLERSIPNNEFLCTKQQFQNFDLKWEMRLKGEGKNAGVQFRSARIPNSHEVEGFQCDAGTIGERLIWGSLYDESRRRTMLAQPPSEKIAAWAKPDDWNSMRIVARDARIQLFVNGHLTVDYVENSPEIPQTGIIGLQIHSGPPTEAWYRNIRIRELPDDDSPDQ